jgi:hypothetical protein
MQKKQKHQRFQFGSNPMKMTEFEKALAEDEKFQREKARRDYIKGIQGRDGGYCPDSE